jgi:hypothetical protein
MMQVFISQPMAGLTENEIFATRNDICNKFNIEDEELIESYRKDNVPHKDVNTSVWCLGDSIRLMSEANLVIFAPGWDEARGCCIEHDICVDYGIPYIEMEPSRRTRMHYIKDIPNYSKLSSSRIG